MAETDIYKIKLGSDTYNLPFLPLTGGTLQKNSASILTINNTNNSTSSGSQYSGVRFAWNGSTVSGIHGKNGSETLWRSNANFANAYEIFDTGNYTSWVPKKDGTGASGTWGISVTGSAASATYASRLGNSSAYHTKATIDDALALKHPLMIPFELSSNISYDASTKKLTNVSSQNSWNRGAYSKEGYYNGCYVSFKPSQTNMYAMIGLNSDPTTDHNYTSIDYCWYIQSGGALCVYENGSSINVSKTSYAVGDELTVIYDGRNVNYFCNGTCYRRIGCTPGTKLYFDSSLYNAGSIYDVHYGPLTNTWPTNLDQLTNGPGYITSAGSITGSSGSCTGNAATATKLQTARNIWGQSFDGSGNISGDVLLGKGTDNIIGSGYSASDASRYNHISFGCAGNGLGYYSGSWTSGNVDAHNFYVGTTNALAFKIKNDTSSHFTNSVTIGKKLTKENGAASWLKLTTPCHTGADGWYVGVDDTTNNSYLTFGYGTTGYTGAASYIRHDGIVYGTGFYKKDGTSVSYAGHTHTKSQITDFAHSHDYLPLSGGTMTGPITSDSGYVILNPIGASYHTTSSSKTGCITINLPASVGNTMVSMWIDVYIYETQKSFSVHCGGYTYENSTWEHSPFAMVYGANHRVRLGHNGTQFVVYIGETNSTWSYPQVSVRNVTLGYEPARANWAKAWSVSFSTSVSNVTYDAKTYAYTNKIFSLSAPGTITTTGHSANDARTGIVPTLNFLSYWNGAYSGTASNLQYCDRGRFGTIVTKATTDYATSGHTHTSFANNIAVSGKVSATLGFYEESDSRLKDIEKPLEVDFNDLAKLQKIYFKFKSKPDKTEIGIIAQEVQEIYPEIVSENEDGNLTVAYDKLAVIALAAVDKLNERLERIEKLLSI